jgi:hypothetical protein
MYTKSKWSTANEEEETEKKNDEVFFLFSCSRPFGDGSWAWFQLFKGCGLSC